MSEKTKEISNKIALLVVIQITLIAVSFLIVESFESQKIFAGNSVNIVGKNRFLTEMVLNDVKDYYIGGKLTGDPISALAIYEKNLQLLKTGGIQNNINLSPLPEEFHGQWENINNLYLDYKTKIQSFVESDSTNYRETKLVEISNLADKLVGQNDILTVQLSLEVQKLTTKLIWLETLLAIINIGALLFMIKMIYNTLKKHAEQVSKMEKDVEVDRKYRILYDELPDLCRTINEKGIILNCNNTYAKSLGYSREEIIGKSIFDHVAGKSLSALHDSFETWKKNGIVKGRDVWFKRKDGTIFPGLICAKNVYDENGKKMGSNTVIRDMSEMYDVKKELEVQKVKRLSSIGELSARIAHDMKNPLSVLKNTVEIMQMRNVNMDEKTKNDFDRLKRAITRIQHQVEDVLDFVRPKGLTLNDHSLHKILEGTLERIRVPNGVTITLPKNDLNVMCDTNKLEIVFMNLITNAIQAMNNKGRIIIRATDNADKVHIEVEDNGPGISDELIPKIFDPLFTTRQIGTGLGLTSCKSIVEMHGGTLTVRNNPTTFTVTLSKRNMIASPTPIASTEEKVWHGASDYKLRDSASNS